jgi:hypothetical protein
MIIDKSAQRIVVVVAAIAAPTPLFVASPGSGFPW